MKALALHVILRRDGREDQRSGLQCKLHFSGSFAPHFNPKHTFFRRFGIVSALFPSWTLVRRFFFLELTSARRSVYAEFARRLTPPFYACCVTVVKQTPSCQAPLHSATSLLPHLLFAPKRRTAAAEMRKQLVQIPVLFGEGQANLRGRSQGDLGKVRATFG